MGGQHLAGFVENGVGETWNVAQLVGEDARGTGLILRYREALSSVVDGILQ